MKDHKYLTLLLFILALKMVVVIGLIVFGMIGLGPDEAQYWTWSKQLDWGYYSKPPGIAWQIWLGTKLFGDTELGVRFLSLLFGFASPLLIYFTGKKCSLSDSASFWAAILFTLSPLGFLGSFFAITDVGMSFFWLLAIYFSLETRYHYAGLIIALGALFKWPIYLFWLILLPLLHLFPNLRRRSLLGGVALSLLGLVPSFIWNSQHGWPTFLHVYYTVVGTNRGEVGTTPLPKGNFFEFLGAQAALVGPIIFMIALIALVGVFRNRKQVPNGVLICFYFGTIPLLTYLALSSYKKMQGNWCDFIYPSLFICIAWFIIDFAAKGQKWFVYGVALSLTLTLLLFSVPYVQSKNILLRTPISYKLNLFHHNIGWEQLTPILTNLGYDPQKHFLFGDKYQTTSEVSFYGPNQQRAYFLNLEGARRNQFSYWRSMAMERMGQDGYFLRPENIPYLHKDQQEKISWFQNELEKYFEKVEYLGMKPLFHSYGNVVKGVFIFKCTLYNGKEPLISHLY